MRSSQTISLFSERPEVSQKSSSFAVSIVVHAIVIALLGYGLLHPPPLRNFKLEERLTVRNLELHMPEPEKQRAAGGSAHSPSANAQNNAEGTKSEAQLAALRQTEDAAVSHLTLLQRKLKNLTKLQQDIPLPTVVLWSPEQTPIKMIIPPPAVKLAPALALASPQLPNREERLADVRISSSELSTQKIPILPSTTTPVTVQGPDVPQAVPTTTSASTAQPTPTNVVALNDVRMPEGHVILPPTNSSTASSSPGALTQGKADPTARTTENSSAAGSGGTKSAGTGIGDAKGTTVHAGSSGNGVGAKIWPAAGNSNGANARTGNGSDNGDGAGEKPTTTRITLPRTGVFGSVVVGVSLVDKYPETARLWGGRMAYTVYLHVGQAKSWILQYTLSKADEAANEGNIARIEAPWAYNIVRPNVPSSVLNADALILHGYVNTDGHFEELKVVFPDDFPQPQFVLDALTQWQFRAATQNGQPKRVEVLLIIPDIE
jgi:hypothetical protein